MHSKHFDRFSLPKQKLMSSGNILLHETLIIVFKMHAYTILYKCLSEQFL